MSQTTYQFVHSFCSSKVSCQSFSSFENLANQRKAERQTSFPTIGLPFSNYQKFLSLDYLELSGQAFKKVHYQFEGSSILFPLKCSSSIFHSLILFPMKILGLKPPSYSISVSRSTSSKPLRVPLLRHKIFPKRTCLC